MYIKRAINSVIDWSYPPFNRYIPSQTFRYGLCGGGNTVLDISLYFLVYNYILKKRILNLSILAISPHIAAFLIVFPITFFTGFWLSKNITFTQSPLQSKTQLLRYGLTVIGCIFLNYILLKIFVESCKFYPTVAKLFTTFIVIIYSYFTQKYFTFKEKRESETSHTSLKHLFSSDIIKR